jgi:hypothetical protein
VPELSDAADIKEWISQARTKLFGSIVSYQEEATTVLGNKQIPIDIRCTAARRLLRTPDVEIAGSHVVRWGCHFSLDDRFRLLQHMNHTFVASDAVVATFLNFSASSVNWRCFPSAIDWTLKCSMHCICTCWNTRLWRPLLTSFFFKQAWLILSNQITKAVMNAKVKSKKKMFQAVAFRKSEASRKLIWPGGRKWREKPFSAAPNFNT